MYIQNQRKFAIAVIWRIEKKINRKFEKEKKTTLEKKINWNYYHKKKYGENLKEIKNNFKKEKKKVEKKEKEIQKIKKEKEIHEYSSALGVTVQTIKRHLNMEKEGDILFSTSYFLKNTRNKLSNEEIMLIIQTWLELCTCKSGDYKQVWNGQYEDAVEDDDNNDDDNNAKNDGDEDDDEGYGGGIGSACIDACCGLNEFNQDNRILEVKQYSYLRCYDATNCNICEQNKISKKFISNNNDKNSEEFKFHQKKIENYEIHLQEINTQRSSYIDNKNDLKLNEAFLKIIQKIYFWSDNGQHFKNHKTFNYFYNLSNNIGIRIIQNFFIACHAANECDGHFGVLKRKEKEAKKMGNCLFSVDEYCTFAQNITKKTISFNLKKLNTYQNEELLYSGMKGVRQIHQIIYNFNNILCKKPIK
ncbi:32 kda heat shock protein [Anaeramoeba flamelloides]|uniref:32 kDa heat shock protein n=1 Tax=Anaeramoeba flamelloides TaxID=1746091 RepID=A0AAV7ZFK9_9EUKA|nr:32 kda heat shock protein [Anaeramoeba flamelloides]